MPVNQFQIFLVTKLKKMIESLIATVCLRVRTRKTRSDSKTDRYEKTPHYKKNEPPGGQKVVV
jgi:hypothetical protein